jgi:hypothetical protein
LQVVISWQANENTDMVLSNSALPANATQVAAPMQITGTAARGTCGSSASAICHIDFIDIPPNQ